MRLKHLHLLSDLTPTTTHRHPSLTPPTASPSPPLQHRSTLQLCPARVSNTTNTVSSKVPAHNTRGQPRMRHAPTTLPAPDELLHARPPRPRPRNAIFYSSSALHERTGVFGKGPPAYAEVACQRHRRAHLSIAPWQAFARLRMRGRDLLRLSFVTPAFKLRRLRSGFDGPFRYRLESRLLYTQEAWVGGILCSQGQRENTSISFCRVLCCLKY